MFLSGSPACTVSQARLGHSLSSAVLAHGQGLCWGALVTMLRDRMGSCCQNPGWIVCGKSVFVMNFPTCFLFNQCSSSSFGSLCCPLSVPVIFPSQHCHCHTCFILSLWECTSSSQFTRNQYIYLRYARKFLFQSIKTLGFTWAITHRLKWKCPEVLLKIEFRKLNFELPLIFCFLLLSSRRKLSKGDSPVFIYCIIIG